MSSIDNSYLFNGGISGHIYGRIEGKDVNSSSASVIQVDEESAVQINLSKEAQATLDKIDKITEQLRYIEKTLGYNELTTAEQKQIQEIAERLDQLHGFNIAETSETYLSLGDERSDANALLQTLNALTSQSEMSEEDQAKIDEIVEQLNKLFTSGSQYARHSFSNISNEQLNEISGLFLDLASATTGLEENAVTKENLSKAADISLQIDTFFNSNGTLNEAKEMTSAEKSEVKNLLAELDNIVDAQETETLSSKIQQIVAETKLNFLQIIMGKGKNSNSNDFVNPLINDEIKYSSYAVQQAQNIIDAYNANKLED